MMMKQGHPWMATVMLAAFVAPAPAQEDVDLSETGKSALSAPAVLREGEPILTYYNIMLGPDKVIGYIEASLELAARDGQPAYRYHTYTEVHFPTRARLRVEVTAAMHANFEPIKIVLKRTVIQATGEETTSLQRAEFADDKVQMFGQVGDQEGGMKVSLPARPLVYGIETLIQRLDFEKFPTFRLNEFDLQTGSARPLKVVASRWEDGTPTVITYNPDDTISYQFWFDNEGSLTRWGEASLPTLFVRTTKEAVEQWKAAKKAEAAPTGNTPSAPPPQP